MDDENNTIGLLDTLALAWIVGGLVFAIAVVVDRDTQPYDRPTVKNTQGTTTR